MMQEGGERGLMCGEREPGWPRLAIFGESHCGSFFAVS